MEKGGGQENLVQEKLNNKKKARLWINVVYKDLTARPNVSFDPKGIEKGASILVRMLIIGT